MAGIEQGPAAPRVTHTSHAAPGINRGVLAFTSDGAPSAHQGTASPGHTHAGCWFWFRYRYCRVTENLRRVPPALNAITGL
jgi:hypothetical protein